MDGEDVWVKVELEPDNWKPDVWFFFLVSLKVNS